MSGEAAEIVVENVEELRFCGAVTGADALEEESGLPGIWHGRLVRSYVWNGFDQSNIRRRV